STCSRKSLFARRERLFVERETLFFRRESLSAQRETLFVEPLSSTCSRESLFVEQESLLVEPVLDNGSTKRVSRSTGKSPPNGKAYLRAPGSGTAPPGR